MDNNDNTEHRGVMWRCGGGDTPQASMSVSTAGNIADFNNDRIVDTKDMRMLVDLWLAQDLLIPEDTNRDGTVSFPDYAEIAESWLVRIEP